ncbi:MAG TPA: hypothetical protein VFS67_26445 [Polyangiaceae bacterium]|nr:hypothetical protein [Polyangiaceae bacterium]
MKQMTSPMGRPSILSAFLLCSGACSDQAPSSDRGSSADPDGANGLSARAEPGAPPRSTPAETNAGSGPSFTDPALQETSNPPILSTGTPQPRSGDTAPAGTGSPSGAVDPGSAGSTPGGAAGPPLIRGDEPTLESSTRPGPFQVSTFSAGLRDGPDYGTQTLHVPQGAEPPFAAVAVVPGFLAAESSIAAWGPFLASHGIVTLTIGTNSPTDSPALRAAALLDALKTIEAENERSGSPLQGEVDVGRLGIMGWSMGGGGTLIASSDTPSLKAAITLAAWSPGVSFSQEQVPVLLFAGSSDAIAGGQSQSFFTSIPESTPKMLFEVRGGSHSIANSPSGGNGEVGRYGLSWLKVFLEGDERYRPFLLQDPTQDSDFRQNLRSP